jgi:outer membrane immunogenic protein
MKMLREFVAGLALMGAAAVSSAPASAQQNWSGLYIGAHVGGAWSGTDWNHESTVLHMNPNPNTNRDTFDQSGWVAGGQLGVQHQYGMWVVGLETSVTGGDLRDHYSRPGTFAVNEISQQTRFLTTVAARLGWAAMQNTLLYIKAGYAGANLHSSLTESPFFNHSVANTAWQNGWTVGAGIEYKFMSNVSLGLEYNYIDLQSKSFSRLDSSAFAITAINVDPDPIHTVTARLNFHFNRPAPVAEPMK